MTACGHSSCLVDRVLASVPQEAKRSECVLVGDIALAMSTTVAMSSLAQWYYIDRTLDSVNALL